MKVIIYPVIFILLIYGNLSAQQKAISKKALRKEWSKLEKQANEIQKTSPNFNFSATLVYKGKSIAQHSLGYATNTTNQRLAMNNKAIYQWDAISKVVTSIAILQLVEGNQLNLDDPITKHLPFLGEKAKDRGKFSKIKIHHLVNVASNIDWLSLQSYLDEKFPKGKIKSLTQAIRPFLEYAIVDNFYTSGEHSRLIINQSQGYLAADGDYALLKMIIEKVSNQSFTQYVNDNIFKPLGMSSAHYGNTPIHLQKYLSELPSTTKNIYNTISLQGRADASKSLKASGQDLLKLLDFLRVKQKKVNKKRYEKILPWRTVKKYYYDININNPESYHIINSKETNRAMVSAFGMLHGNNAFIGQMGINNNYLLMFLSSTKDPIGVLCMVRLQDVQSQKERIAILNLVSKISDFMQIYKFD